MKATGAKIYAIGVGKPCTRGSNQNKCYKPEELEQIASSAENIFEIDSYDKLIANRYSLLFSHQFYYSYTFSFGDDCNDTKEAPKPVTTVPPIAPPVVTVPMPNCPDAAIDLLFVIDGSGSIGEKRFKLMKSWISEVANEFNINDDLTRVALIHYSRKSLIEFGFQRGQTNAEITAAIASIDYNGGKTFTGNALLEAEGLLQFEMNNSEKSDQSVDQAYNVWLFADPTRVAVKD